jgi:hypothetical protein
MSIGQTKVVDFVYIDPVTNDLVLVISDHLQWTGNGVPWTDEDKEHLYLLQEKIYGYLDFVETGQIYKTFPQGKGKPIIIAVHCKYPISSEAQEFYFKFSSVVEDAGLKLRYGLFSKKKGLI